MSFGLCGRERGWDDLGEWHWNMYNVIYETNRQSRFDAWYWMLGAGALRWPRGDGTGREEGGVFRMGNTCTPMADSCWCMAKPIQYCKVRRLLYFLRVWTNMIFRIEFHPSGSQSQAVQPDPRTGLVVWKMHGICGHPDSRGSPCSLTAGSSQCQWEAVPACWGARGVPVLGFNTRLAFCLLA